MGKYFNPGNGLFRGDSVSKYYVDKSGLIEYTNSVIGDNIFKYICVSRPRRFGKSFAADMLTAYYVRGCDSHAMFDGREISKCEDYETNINRYNVIHVDISGYMKSCPSDCSVKEVLDKLYSKLTTEIEDEYPGIVPGKDDTFPDYLNKVYNKTDIPFIFVIDEWDAIFRNSKEDIEGQKAYLNFLESMLKGKEYVALAYMTGILPIKKYGTHSALNMFKEYTMLRPGPVKKFIGFTEEDVEKLCDGSDFTKDDIKDWYDGYTLGGLEIYNPNSVVSALSEGVLDDYWNKTEMFEDLLSYITVNVDGLHDVILKLLAKEIYVLPSYNSFQNDLVNLESKNDHLIALIHLGYLSYDSRDGTLKIPNHEIRIQFVDSLDSMSRSIVAKFYDYSNRLLDATTKADAKGVAEMLGRIFAELTKRTAYPYENAFGDFVDFAYMCANDYYDVIPEAPTRWLKKADFVLYPNLLRARKDRTYLPGIIIELKNNKSATEAADQIEEKGYDDYFEQRKYHGDVIHVGLDFQKVTPEERQTIAAQEVSSEDGVSVGNDANLNEQSKIVHFCDIRKYTI